MSADIEHVQRASAAADELVNNLNALCLSPEPALARIAQDELHWAYVQAKRIAKLLALAEFKKTAEGIEDIIAASHKFGEKG